MNDQQKNKAEILKLIEKLWNTHPQQRLGQLLTNYVIKEEKLFFQEDEVTELNLRRELK